MSSKKPRRKTARVVAVIAGLSFGVGAVSLTLPSGTIGAQQLMARVSDALSTIAGRSPGERTAAALAKSKGKNPALARKNRKRNLPGDDAPGSSRIIDTADISDLIGEPDPLGAGDFADDPDPGIVTDNLPPVGVPGIVTPVIFGNPGGGGGGGSGGGGGGGGGSDPNDPNDPDPQDPQIPAVPEPESWALLLVGFGLGGWALRRSRRPLLGKTDQSCDTAIS